MATRYHPNFEKGVFGNSLHTEKDLIIKVDGSPLYMLGRLMAIKSWGRKKIIQIEQTGSRQNPDPNSITFEMKARSKGKTIPMPPGKYRVETYAYFTGQGGKKWGDNFYVV